ncbi:MAG: zinc ABC transporter substrate-binding protein, partial [Neisseriaceae bacterium]|nr:zinc ABC transporter substrate-binding protein [Neisseriaceae bacterium]
MKKIFAFLLLSFLSIHLSYADKLKVMASFSILGDWLQEIGGNRVEVTNLVPLNQESHHYETTAKDQIALKQADVIFIQGLHFESRDILNAIKPYPDKTAIASNVFTSQDLIPLIQYNFSDQDVQKVNDKEAQLFDPHTWHSFELTKKSVLSIRNQLIEKNPSNWKYYNRRTKDYLKKLDELEKWSNT